MSLLVDTSVWSLALRRDSPPAVPEVNALRDALIGRDPVLITGVILQELLQGAVREATRKKIIERFSALELVHPRRVDYIAAAGVRNECRRAGVQLGTIDALIATLCIVHRLTLLTTDKDFHHAAQHTALRVWAPAAPQA